MIRYLTAGESHGKALVGIIEGVPAGIDLSSEYIDLQLQRRQQWYGRGSRMRIEEDAVEIISGVRHGKTLGSPISLMIRNLDSKNWEDLMSIEQSSDSHDPISIPRPGHADYSGAIKYGFDDLRNVIERSSARETAMRVACCTIARKLLEELGINIGSYVVRIGSNTVSDLKEIKERIQNLLHQHEGALNLSHAADKSVVRFLDEEIEARVIDEIDKAKKEGDTLGGIFEIIVTGVPIGLGSYVHYDRRLDGRLAQVLMSIPAVKGVEIGLGFEGANMHGSKVHDPFTIVNGEIKRTSNNAGGIEGGITNGEPIVLRAVMKPIPTLAKPLQSVHLIDMKEVEARYERSDICAVPSCSIIGEAVIAPVLANAMLEKYGGDSLEEIRARYFGERG